MTQYWSALASLGLVLAASLALPAHAATTQDPVTAIDIALEPDATMVTHAKAANAVLLKDFPKGFALDATHHPHVTVLQTFVKTTDLPKVYVATSRVLQEENYKTWKLTAFKYYYIPAGPIGVAGIVAKPTPDLLRIQKEVIEAVTPYMAKTGTAAAFMSTQGGRDIQPELIAYVTDFLQIASGPKFNPHVTTGVGTKAFLDALLAKPFDDFTFSPVGASVYQLGAYGTARKALKVF
jgi:hypothetical protein